MTEIDFQIWIWDLFLVLMSGYSIIFANFSSGIKKTYQPSKDTVSFLKA